MTKETYRELEGLAVQAVKDGLHGDVERLAMGLQALKTLHAIRFTAPATQHGADAFLE